MVVKIKYKGQWRTVIGETDSKYKVQLLTDKTVFTLIDKYSKDITETEQREHKNRQPTGKIRFNQLSVEEKMLIDAVYRTGRYYVKEICNLYNITPHTLNRVVSEQNELRSKTN